jgi:hypothetical protein
MVHAAVSEPLSMDMLLRLMVLKLLLDLLVVLVE